MNIIDIAIILVLIIGALIGFRNGAIKTLTGFIGLFVVVVVAFMFKNQLSVILYENLPFFNFFGAIKGIQVINIVLYEVLSFIIIASLLMAALHIILVATGLFEKILKMTVILSIPSKLLGIVVGILQYYVYVFIALFIISLPIFHLNIINESEYGGKILNETPVLSSYANKSVDVYNKIYNIVDNRNKKDDAELNKEVLQVMLETKFITYDSARQLIDSNKIYLKDKEFIENYK